MQDQHSSNFARDTWRLRIANNTTPAAVTRFPARRRGRGNNTTAPYSGGSLPAGDFPSGAHWKRPSACSPSTSSVSTTRSSPPCPGPNEQSSFLLADPAATFSAGHIHFQIGDGSWHVANANAQVPLNQWVHVAATRKANEDAMIYYNGVLQPSASVPWWGTISYAGAWFAIGQQKDLARPFNGQIDEARIYNRALTPAEVTALAGQGP